MKSATVIIGAYKDKTGRSIKLTPTGQKLENYLGGRLTMGLKATKSFPDLGEVRMFNEINSLFKSVVVAGLGDEFAGYNVQEERDDRKEAIRIATGNAVKGLKGIECDKVLVDSCGHAESAAEGVSLASWLYQEPQLKSCPRVELIDCCDHTGWKIGVHKAAAQILASQLQKVPANHLTPQVFAQSAIDFLSEYNINVVVRTVEWAKLKKLNAFLAVGRRACNAIFIELPYEGCDPNIRPIVIVGKGVTFDTEGLYIKSCKEMEGDMTGAAVIVATMRAVAALQLPINIRAVIPLCANMVQGGAFKPGDKVSAHNGKTILIENTNCEGLLLHADALSYARKFNPKFILDIETLTEDSHDVIGLGATPVTSNNDSLYEVMRVASIHTGDRVSRLPLWHYVSDDMTPYKSVTTNKGPHLIGAGPNKGAAFLREFVPPNTDWIHLDVKSGLMTSGVASPYLGHMSGRSTTNLIEFLAQLSCNNTIENSVRQV